MGKFTRNNSAILSEFLSDAEEHLEEILSRITGSDYISIDSATIAFMEREIHSLKGNAQLIGFHSLAQIAHTLETSIESARKFGDSLSSEIWEQIYQGLQLLDRMVKNIKNGQAEEDFSRESGQLVAKLAEIITRHLHASPQPFGKDVAIGQILPPPAPAAQSLPADPELKPANITVTPALTIVPGDEPTGKMKNAAPGHDSLASESLRVPVTLLDNLMNLVGELVLIRNQVVQKSVKKSSDSEFINLSQRLDVITTELQNGIMKTRMQPIGTILTKFHRMVRDLSRELDKEIQFKIDGAETELDKTLIEAVKDPLTHIIRNSIDHGIESKAERSKHGKTKTGNVLIRAFHEGGQIVIEVNDDGRGLQRKKIGSKAIERGLVTAETLKKMSDREICNLIFLAGFSTAEKVSNISGRGVGMDVVRNNIEKIGGVVDVSSVEGQGATIRLKIPLTLAIVPALLIKTEGHCFAIPQVNLTELVRLNKNNEQQDNRIEYLQGRAVFRLRSKLLPLVSLDELLQIKPVDPGRLSVREEISIVVLKSDAGKFGLVVDEIDDSTDIVVKSLSGFLKKLDVYSGATVLGDGSVALVLDVAGLAEQAQILSLERMGENSDSTSMDVRHQENSEFLLLDIGLPGHFCMPLFLVNRLEEFPRHRLEYTGEQLVVQYRESILPLIDVSRIISGQETSLSDSNVCSVVVIQHDGKFYGLVVERILDIVALSGGINESVRDKDCILGTQIHGNHIVTVIDAFRLIQQNSTASKPDMAIAKRKIRVLYAEDSAFFQRQIARMLQDEGFQVTSATNGEEVLQNLENSGSSAFDVIVSDLDMPILDGFQLVERIRSHNLWKTLPVLAFSSRNKMLVESQALNAGFDQYLEKSDLGSLIVALYECASEMQEVKRGA